jgi:DNA-binding transcriptional ArsR family regulator
MADQRMELGEVLAALADPHRRRVVRDLACDLSDGERSCHSFALPVSKSTSTHHFKVLTDAGLINNVHHGNRNAVSLRRIDIDKRFPGLLALVVAENDERA